MKYSNNGFASAATSLDLETKREIDRFNARLRHFTGVAASVLADTMKLWEEIWESCQDPRTPEQIIDGVEIDPGDLPAGGWPEFKEKLHLLGQQLDYIERLCDGSLDETPAAEREADDGE